MFWRQGDQSIGELNIHTKSLALFHPLMTSVPRVSIKICTLMLNQYCYQLETVMQEFIKPDQVSYKLYLDDNINCCLTIEAHEVLY